MHRLGETGAEAFLIMRMARHYSVSVSERYVHPTPEAMERATANLEAAGGGLPEVQTGTKTGTRALAAASSPAQVVDNQGLPT